MGDVRERILACRLGLQYVVEGGGGVKDGDSYAAINQGLRIVNEHVGLC